MRTVAGNGQDSTKAHSAKSRMQRHGKDHPLKTMANEAANRLCHDDLSDLVALDSGSYATVLIVCIAQQPDFERAKLGR